MTTATELNGLIGLKYHRRKQNFQRSKGKEMERGETLPVVRTSDGAISFLSCCVPYLSCELKFKKVRNIEVNDAVKVTVMFAAVAICRYLQSK